MYIDLGAGEHVHRADRGRPRATRALVNGLLRRLLQIRVLPVRGTCTWGGWIGTIDAYRTLVRLIHSIL